MKRLKLLLTLYFSFFIIVILCLHFSAPDILVQSDAVLSDFGADPRTSTIFNLMIVLSSIVIGFVFYKISKTLNNSRDSIFIKTLYFAIAIGLLVLGAFPVNINRIVHWGGALSFFIGILILSIYTVLFSRRLWLRLIIVLLLLTAIIFPNRLYLETVGILLIAGYLILI